MIIEIPTIKRESNGDEIITKRESMKVEIDTSLQAHLKWDEHFRESMGCDLTTYTGRIQNLLKDEGKARAEMLSVLKLLYCYVNGKEIPTFGDFVKLFDLEIAEEILDKISVVLEQVGKSATTTKN